MEEDLYIPRDTSDREEIKRLRKIRNKLKKERQKTQKLHSKNDLSINSTNGHIAIVHQDIFNKVNNESDDSIIKKKGKRQDLLVNIGALCSKQACSIPQATKSNADGNVKCLVPNRLDKSQPVLLKGKHSEIIKEKRMSTLKKAIIESKQTDIPLTRNEIENKYTYSDNLVTEKLDQLSSSFIQELVTLQEKYFKRDPKKAVIKRRYVVGFHQSKKYLKMKKIQILFIATDIKLQKDDPLDSLINELVSLARENDILYTFVLKRRLLGRLTLKHVPVACMGVLNYDGLNTQFKLLCEEVTYCRDHFSKEVEDGNTNNEIYEDLLYKIKEVL